MRLTYDKTQFLLDNEPLTIISGAIHYFRVVPEYWQDRLEKLKNAGFNTVETYMPWNLHEPSPGQFDFSGMLDIERFISLAEKLGLYVIIRPGPYICAEWEFGGLPAWLLNIEGMALRCYNQPFLKCAQAYLHEVFRHIKPHLLENGGPVIMVQLENEYGSYGMDHAYLRALLDIYHQEEVNAFIFTSDGDDMSMLNGGTLPDVFKVVNFGSQATRNFQHLREVQPEGPLMCGEFWNGWFDHWGEAHHVRTADDTAQALEEILAQGGSVNFYMFHGGTNFNFYNGANHDKVYQPTVTSYDYHCLLSENGDMTPKYEACKAVLKAHGFPTDMLEVHNQPTCAYGKLRLSQSAPLFSHLDEIVTKRLSCPRVLPMEKVGQNFGFILYRTTLKGPFQSRPLTLREVHDRALVFFDGQYQGVIERDQPSDTIQVAVERGQTLTLDILVENMGRVNYGPELYDYKGITEAVLLGIQEVHDWQIMCLPLDDLSRLQYEDRLYLEGPCFYKGELEVEKAQDTFVYLDHFHKGNVFINGFNLGRYFERGPQRSLYLPGPLLKPGKNTIEIFELHGTDLAEIECRDAADLG